MVRNLFVLSLLSFAVVGCMGPKKGPSPVTDGGLDTSVVPAAGLTPVNPTLAPEPAPAAPVKKATKSKGKLPLGNAGNK
jgi:hypothetical protein